MTIKQYVLFVLQNYPESRSDDEVLINLVFKEYAKDHSISVLYVDNTIKALGLFPSIRSIIRQRQRIQAKHPELTDQQAVEERAAQEAEYYEEYISELDSDLDFSDFDPDQLTF